jgi:hypothetical protein
MNKLSRATQQCIEDFVTSVLEFVPFRRTMSRYEKRAIGYALYTILRSQESTWECSSRFTEEDETQKNASKFEFHMSDYEIAGGLGGLHIGQFFALAEVVCDYIEFENSIFDEIYEVQHRAKFSLFMDLVFLFHQWEKNYAIELAHKKSMADDDEMDY